MKHTSRTWVSGHIVQLDLFSAVRQFRHIQTLTASGVKFRHLHAICTGYSVPPDITRQPSNFTPE